MPSIAQHVQRWFCLFIINQEWFVRLVLSLCQKSENYHLFNYEHLTTATSTTKHVFMLAIPIKHTQDQSHDQTLLFPQHQMITSMHAGDAILPALQKYESLVIRLTQCHSIMCSFDCVHVCSSESVKELHCVVAVTNGFVAKGGSQCTRAGQAIILLQYFVSSFAPEFGLCNHYQKQFRINVCILKKGGGRNWMQKLNYLCWNCCV